MIGLLPAQLVACLLPDLRGIKSLGAIDRSLRRRFAVAMDIERVTASGELLHVEPVRRGQVAGRVENRQPLIEIDLAPVDLLKLRDRNAGAVRVLR